MMSETGLVTGDQRQSTGEATANMAVAATLVAVAATNVVGTLVLATADAVAEAALVASTADAVVASPEAAKGEARGVEKPLSLQSSYRTLDRSKLGSVMLERPVGTTAVRRANSSSSSQTDRSRD